MIELLAPAGSMESLKASVESGADAVYLSGKMFGARAYASNFDEQAMREAIQFAHQRDVKVHVTVNTLVDNAEIPALADYLRFLYEAGADAALIQDLGAARLARTVVPDLPLHASTQMSVNNLAGVLALQELGFSRVVLAREVTLKDIRHICQKCDVEIEVFGHGAICVCYSGQCLMSSMIGGRSGNRGRCAQPCRLPYTLIDKNGKDVLHDAGKYLLSPRDMNTIKLLPELVEAGVASLKLEGRMKKPEYVAVVVDSYRKKIDSCYRSNDASDDDDNEINKNLSQIFNRDFTTAYLEKKQGRNMMSDKRPNNRGRLIGRVVRYDDKKRRAVLKLTDEVAIGDTLDFWVKVGGRVNTTLTEILAKGSQVQSAQAGTEISIPVPSRVHPHDRVFKVFDARLTAHARSFFTTGAPVRRFALDLKVQAHLGQPFAVSGTDKDGFTATAVSDFIVEKALKRAMDEQTVRKQMNRLGTTVYELRNLECDIDDGVIVPMSVMNDTRRQLTDALTAQRLASFDRPKLKQADNKAWQSDMQMAKLKPAVPQLVAAADSLVKVRSAIEGGADMVLFGGDTYDHSYLSADDYTEAAQLCRQSDVKIAFGTPRIVRDSEQAAFENWLKKINAAGVQPDAVYAHSLAQMYLLRRDTDSDIWADYSFNTYNDITLAFLRDYGITGAVVSPELNFKQIEPLVKASPLPLECIVHGNMELMVSEYCVLGSFLGGLDKGACSQPCTKNSYWLSDRKNEKFPVVTDQFCHMHLLNAKELNMLAHVPEFTRLGIGKIRIDGRYMNEGKLKKICRLYRRVLDEGANSSILQPGNIAQYEQDITRGHYFRGVE